MINVLEWKAKLNALGLISDMGFLEIRPEDSQIWYDPIPQSYEEYRQKYIKFFNRKLPG